MAGTTTEWLVDAAANATLIVTIPAGSVAVGYDGRSGWVIDHISLMCQVVNQMVLWARSVLHLVKSST
ncbi:MAG: hypothetical protein R2795_08895 [Saprospiraceae bacterium]